MLIELAKTLRGRLARLKHRCGMTEVADVADVRGRPIVSFCSSATRLYL